MRITGLMGNILCLSQTFESVQKYLYILQDETKGCVKILQQYQNC